MLLLPPYIGPMVFSPGFCLRDGPIVPQCPFCQILVGP